MFGDFGSFKIINKINQYISRNKKSKNIKIVLCVPNTLIHFFREKLKTRNILFGAQNCQHYHGYGPFTGSISTLMLKKVGANFVILGHSENRSEGETNKLIKKKIKSALSQKLNIIFCVGETLKQKRANKTFSVIRSQLKGSLENKMNLKKIIFAYEPVWSIGTNKIPKAKELQKIIRFIKKDFRQIFKINKLPLVLYGGSVNSKNISLLASIDEIDGFLIGSASQSSKKFIDIIKNYYK